MKRIGLGLTILWAAILLGGCPIYSGSRNYPTCDSTGQCFDCPSGSTPSGGTCVPWECNSSRDCPSGTTCVNYTCQMVADATGPGCGCPTGYVCKLADRQIQCVPEGNLGVDASDAAPVVHDAAPADALPDATARSDANADATSVDATPVDATPSDAATSSDATDASIAPDASDAGPVVDAAPPVARCNAEGDCVAGDRCVDGRCTPQGELCSDGTQCVVAGSSCVDGVCEPHCSAGAPCAAGYQCDFARGVCNLNPTPCAGSGSSTCLGGSTCVEGHCVAPCATDDASPACPAGQICVNDGCIPDEAAQFACKNDGQSGTLATTCAAADICLHHDCYAACDPEAGAAACADPSATCKEVTVGAGTYVVCAPATSLGSDCDPASGSACASGVCIDGFCR